MRCWGLGLRAYCLGLGAHFGLESSKKEFKTERKWKMKVGFKVIVLCNHLEGLGLIHNILNSEVLSHKPPYAPPQDEPQKISLCF